MNLTAFASTATTGASVAPTLPSAGSGFVLDGDGLVIPEKWIPARRRWDRLALPVRQKWSAEYLEELAAVPELVLKPERPKRASAPRFTTAAAIRWGRRQGWTLIDRERFDVRTKRHHDLMLGVDALFEGPEGLIGVQGAGKSERKAHWERFVSRGGPEKAARRHVRVVYVEFLRGQSEPIVTEWWS